MRLRRGFVKAAAAAVTVVAAAFGILVAANVAMFRNAVADELTEVQRRELENVLNAGFPGRGKILSALPYNLERPRLDVRADSAVLVNCSNGNVLFEKNADEVIPPASMTKLFVMYVVLEEISAGRMSYSQVIPVPEESLACNMPPRSSLMFLGEGQIVTVEELLLGLSICSGNDAAYALAYTISGGMEPFIARMNTLAEELELEHTRFVESSGYSELNTTTAREMAAFSRIYISRHPEAIEKFHSVNSFTYPKPHNMAPGDRWGAQDFSGGLPRHITMGITQRNTNPLLGTLDGCDGLKTGYIDESGYNLSLTAARDGNRFISVTMRGPGKNTAEGNAGRVHDGTALMEWAFSSFADYDASGALLEYPVMCAGGRQRKILLVPAFSETVLTVPFITGATKNECAASVTVAVEIPDYVDGGILAGTVCGNVKFMLAGHLLWNVPLVADRSVRKSGFLMRLGTTAAVKILS